MLKELLEAALLGTVQGLTEFLPISSTGHLILTERALGIDQDRYGLTFDAALHLGTLLALLTFFGSTWLRLAGAGVRAAHRRSLDDPMGRMAWLILLGTLPAAVAGLLFEDVIADTLRSPWVVATALISFSAVFLLAEAVGRRRRAVEDLTWADSLIIGAGQAVALVPGVSRSGATICAGLFRDIDRRDAAHFAFLLSAPVVAAAGGKSALDFARALADGTLGRDDAAFFGVGLIFAAAVGYVTIGALLRFLASNSLRWFAGYRVALGLFVYAFLAGQLIL